MKSKPSKAKGAENEPSGAQVRRSAGLAAWVKQVKAHAESKGFGWLIDLKGDYGDMFNDGLTPEEAFEEELDAARQCC